MCDIVWVFGRVGNWRFDVGVCVGFFKWVGYFDCDIYWVEYLEYDVGRWCVMWRVGVWDVVFGGRLGYL